MSDKAIQVIYITLLEFNSKLLKHSIMSASSCKRWLPIRLHIVWLYVPKIESQFFGDYFITYVRECVLRQQKHFVQLKSPFFIRCYLDLGKMQVWLHCFGRIVHKKGNVEAYAQTRLMRGWVAQSPADPFWKRAR